MMNLFEIFVLCGLVVPFVVCLRGNSNPVWRIQTLEECEAENKTFCFTGMYSDDKTRPEINRFVSSNARIFKHFQIHRMTSDHMALINRTNLDDRNITSIKNSVKNVRIKRDAVSSNDSITESGNFSSSNDPDGGPHVDCSSVCCVSEDMTPPFSHIKENDGWQQVASTPEFPQRVSFYTETCTSTQSPCVGVKSVDDTLSPRCVQFYRHHAIAVFNRTTGLTFRYIEVPVTCKCVLAPKDQDVTPSGPSLAILQMLQGATTPSN